MIERWCSSSPTRQLLRGIEQGKSGRRSRAARRAVDLAVGEDGHVPLGQRVGALVLPEDDAVDIPQLRLDRVHDLVPILEHALQLAAELDQPRQLGRLDTLRQRGVEGAAEGDVDERVADLETGRPHERRHVAEGDRAHTAVRDDARVSRRPDGTSTTTRFSPSRRSTMPSSSAQVTSAIVPCPQAVE